MNKIRLSNKLTLWYLTGAQNLAIWGHYKQRCNQQDFQKRSTVSTVAASTPQWMLASVPATSLHSLSSKNGGVTFPIYAKGDRKTIKQVEQMRKDGRVDITVEADCSESTTAHMWLTNRIEKIVDRKKAKITSSVSGALQRTWCKEQKNLSCFFLGGEQRNVYILNKKRSNQSVYCIPVPNKL